MHRLEGKVAVVTGRPRALARPLQSILARRALRWWSTTRPANRAPTRWSSALPQRAESHRVQADVSQPKDITRLFAETKAAYGKLDILVNNAGVYEFAPLESITPEHFHKQFNLNVLGLLLTTQEAVKLIDGKGGSIINIGSIVGSMPVATGSVYSATKGAVDNITISLSKELGPKKIRVNSLDPGMVETEGFHSAGLTESDFRRRLSRKLHWAASRSRQDIARAAVFFASDEAGWVTGQALIAAGGGKLIKRSTSAGRRLHQVFSTGTPCSHRSQDLASL